MHARGSTWNEIANELSSDVPTVKKWIMGRKA
jgi:hypothetical protein